MKDLKEITSGPIGLDLTIDEFDHLGWQGTKEERILSVLEPRYANRQIWHYAGGNCQIIRGRTYIH